MFVRPEYATQECPKGDSPMILGFLLGLVSIGTAVSISGNPNCSSLVFFEGNQTTPRTIPVSCLSTGEGADAWALMFFLLGLIPIGYALYLLLDEFGPVRSGSKVASADPPSVSSSESKSRADSGDAVDHLSAAEHKEDAVPASLQPTYSDDMLDPLWSDEDFSRLAQDLVQIGVNPSQIGTLESKFDFDPDWDPGEFFTISHQLSGALQTHHREEFWWVDCWLLRKDKWGLLRFKIDSDGVFIAAPEDETPGIDEVFTIEGTPSTEAILARIWLTSARFAARPFYPLAANSRPLSNRISEGNSDFPFLAIGRLGDFVRNASENLSKIELSKQDAELASAYKSFLNSFPEGEVDRLLHMATN